MKTLTEQLRSDYDEVQYDSSCSPFTRPDHLNVVGRLSGFEAAPPEQCRVLEIGCASGQNLIPMAQALPGSRFVGIDLSVNQIERGKKTISDIGAGNIELRCQNLLDFNDAEPFDYIFVHGLYTWVPTDVRDRLMSLCHSLLAPRGLAYFSFNTLPGWHMKMATRGLMLFHGRGAKTVPERVAKGREAMSIAAGPLNQGATPYILGLRAVGQVVAAAPAWYLAHDDLGAVNDPVYFRAFAEHAKSHGLRYLSSAQLATNVFKRLPPELQKQLRQFSNDIIELEQYADFLRGTPFRDAVMCRDDAVLSPVSETTAIQNLHLAAGLIEEILRTGPREKPTVRFLNPRTKQDLKTGDERFIAVLRHLSKAWPHAVSFKDLIAFKTKDNNASTDDALAKALLGAYDHYVIELWPRPTTFLASHREYPKVTPLARAQAVEKQTIINLRHGEYLPSNPAVGFLIPLMDGTRDHDALIAQLREAISGDTVATNMPKGTNISNAELTKVVEGALQELADHSLLWAG